MLVQGTLPGFARPRRPRRRRRAGPDPAESESRARADHQFAEWRQAFVGFLSRLPPERRAELHRRLQPAARVSRRELRRAA